MTKPYAYYNEIDPFAVATLKRLISRGEIMQGDVDERSIEDITPADLKGYTQHHFFAGFGVWSYALRRAGWPDWRPVATCSCPCQPLSAAGKGLGFADERHLWPAFYHLLVQCRFERVYGEQVASSLADTWIDLVHADVEAVDYTFGCVPFPSASVGAPHIRDRNYWMAYAKSFGSGSGLRDSGQAERGFAVAADRRAIRGLADSDRQRRHGQHALLHGHEAGRQPDHSSEVAGRGEAGRLGDDDDARLSQQQCVPGILREESGARSRQAAERASRTDGRMALAHAGGLADAHGRDTGAERQQRGGEQRQQPFDGSLSHDGRPGPVNGLWSAADWLHCRDGKWRPVESGTFPLVNGAPARVGRLRGYGNAINAEQAATFIRATMDVDAGADLV